MVSGKQVRAVQKKEADAKRREQERLAAEREREAEAEEAALFEAQQQEVDSYLAILTDSERSELNERFELRMRSNPISRKTWERREEAPHCYMFQGCWREFVLGEMNNNPISQS